MKKLLGLLALRAPTRGIRRGNHTRSRSGYYLRQPMCPRTPLGSATPEHMFLDRRIPSIPIQLDALDIVGLPAARLHQQSGDGSDSGEDPVFCKGACKGVPYRTLKLFTSMPNLDSKVVDAAIVDTQLPIVDKQIPIEDKQNPIIEP